MDRTVIWLWLSLHFGAGTSIYEKLYSYFGDEYEIYNSDDSDVEPIEWLTESQKRKLLDKNLDHAHEVMDWCIDNDVEVISYASDNYPYALKRIKNFPAVLYCLGEMPDFNDELAISVVGTRRMTMYGQKSAYSLGYGLAKGGAIVVSGMALGIDATASLGALNALGRTVVVLGSGIDVVYPRQNTQLMRKIIENGAVLTEYAPGTPPNARNFPIRNRIISGLSQGTVVVEGDENSGAMITASHAKEQKKALFAVPGPIGAFSSTGPNALVRDGAMVATSAIDILEYFLDGYAHKISIQGAKIRPIFNRNSLKIASPNAIDEEQEEYLNKSKALKKESKKLARSFKEGKKEKADPKIEIPPFDPSELSEDERKIYDLMEVGKPTTEDDLIQHGYASADITSIFTMLEIAGAIEKKPGGFFVKR